MALYKPPTKVTTVSQPYLSVVVRADPDWARGKFWDIDYEFDGGIYGKDFFANPYKRGAYNTPTKSTSVSYTGPATFAAGDMTGVGFDFVTLTSTGAAPGTLTTRTGAQMFGDIAGATPLMQWRLRIANIGGGGALQLKPGVGVSLQGDAPIKNNTFSDFIATLTDASHAVLQTVSSGNPYGSISH